jgi:hypothetical protein
VSRWAGENNANDSVGLNHGTAFPTVNYTAGAIGQGFLFPDSGYLDIPNPAAGGLISPSGFSFASWVRFDGADPPPAGGPGAISQLGSTSSGFLLRQAGSNSVGFYVNTSGMAFDYAIIDTGSTSPPTFWNFGELSHIAATFDAATHTMALYKNGELVASRSDVPGGNMAVHPGDVFLIGRENWVGATLDGMLDDVRFYDHALSGPEVAALVPEPSSGLLFLLAAVRAISRRRLVATGSC